MSELQVMLPATLETFFEESGFAAPCHYERRRYARLNVRECVEIEFLGIDGSPSRRKVAHDLAISKDVSKSGVAILYHEQVFPEERFRVDLRGQRLTAVVVRCRKLGTRCYEVGAAIVESERVDW